MFRIGEFSKLTQVSVRMLRYYDESGLLKPAETDKFTSYRLYDVSQIADLNKIVFLRDLGFGIADIAEALDHWSDDFITEQLDKKRQEIEDKIQAERKRLDKIKLAKEDIQREKISINYNVIIKSIPGYQVFSLRRRVPDYYAEGYLWKEMTAYVSRHNITLTGETFSIYHDLDYREKDVDIELCAVVDQMQESRDGFVYRNTEPVPVMASTMVYGPFENISGAFLALANWLQEHNQYRMAGTSRQIVHRGQWNEEDPAKYLTEIQVPLENM